MTRTKNRVFMIAPEQNPSEFLIELKEIIRMLLFMGTGMRMMLFALSIKMSIMWVSFAA